MSVKPILFNTEMVRATLDGRKTVTRRVVKPQPIFVKSVEHGPDGFCFACENRLGKWEYHVAPRYRPGDILWVRETWNRGYIDSSYAELSNEYWFEEYHKRDGSYLDISSRYVYRANFTRDEEYELGTLDEDNTPRPMPWRPSIHMPREAARIWLRVTDVRVERVQEITWQQAAAEGCQGEACDELEPRNDGLLELPTLRGAFRNLWDSTVKPADRDRYGWAANPFCWVISFERISKDEAMQ